MSKRADRVVLQLADTIRKKNEDYGCSAFEPPPFVNNVNREQALLVRLGDKFRRLQNLADNKEPNFEAAHDTLLDFAGYLFLLMIIKEYKLDEDNAKKLERYQFPHALNVVGEKFWRAELPHYGIESGYDFLHKIATIVKKKEYEKAFCITINVLMNYGLGEQE